MNIQGFTPSITAPTTSANAHAATGSAGTSGSGSTAPAGDSSTSLQDTFLNLLVTELQNQDPTSPVDPTAMVGQLVSLNQLDQLISINQTLSSMTPASSTASGSASASADPLGAATANVDVEQRGAELQCGDCRRAQPDAGDQHQRNQCGFDHELVRQRIRRTPTLNFTVSGGR